MRLVSESDEYENQRIVVCLSDSDNEDDPESEFRLAPSVPELDSIVIVRSQVVRQELKETESSKAVKDEIMELIAEPSGSGAMSENKKVSASRVGMSLEKVRSSHPKPKISDIRVYSYDEMIESMNLSLIFLLWRKNFNFVDIN